MVTKRLIIFFSLLAILSSCQKRQNNLDREILLTVIWEETRSTEDGTQASYLYNFDQDGILYIYLLERGAAVASGEHRYIFDPQEEIIAIDELGIAQVTSLSVDRLQLKWRSSDKTLRLDRYRGDVAIP